MMWCGRCRTAVLVTLDIFTEKGTPIYKQTFDWKELVPAPYSKLDDDAFTRVRIILMNGIESPRPIEEQHVTLMHELCEVYNYYSCFESETNKRIKHIWERFLSYELAHFHYVKELIERFEVRDVAAMIGQELPDPIRYESRSAIEHVSTREVLRPRASQRALSGRLGRSWHRSLLLGFRPRGSSWMTTHLRTGPQSHRRRARAGPCGSKKAGTEELYPSC